MQFLSASRAVWKCLTWGVSLCLVAAWCSCWVPGVLVNLNPRVGWCALPRCLVHLR